MRAIDGSKFRQLAILLAGDPINSHDFVINSLHYLGDWADEKVDATENGPIVRETGEKYIQFLER